MDRTFNLQGMFTIRGVSKPETLHLTLSGKETGHGEIAGTMVFDRNPIYKIAEGCAARVSHFPLNP